MMKKYFMTRFAVVLFAAASMVAVSSCSDDEPQDDPKNPTEIDTDGGLKVFDNIIFNETELGNGDQEIVFRGKQTIAKGTYLLKGWIYVEDGSELTIEPGTIIKGDKATRAALIIEPGAKIYAEGTETEPIVFTSASPAGQRKPGDWGGLIICGRARNNQGTQQIEGGPRTQHGGDNDSDNSGVLKYVRVEFAGYPFERDKEINGITLGSVGSGTTIDYVQVSFSNDDAYEWFGGTVNAKHLISYKTWDDDFDTDNGFSGHVQYGLVVRDSRLADTSRSNGFESDNCSDGADVSPYTTALFSNITFIGPKAVDASFENTVDYINGGSYYPDNTSALGLFQSAMQIRRNSRLNCINSFAVGYPIGFMLDNQRGSTQESAQEGLLKLQNIWLADMDIVGSDANGLYQDVLVTGYDENSDPIVDETQPSFSSTFFTAQPGNRVVESAELMLTGASEIQGLSVNYRPQAGSPLMTAAQFNGESNIDVVDYIGAFGSDNWLEGWTNFDPNNAEY